MKPQTGAWGIPGGQWLGLWVSTAKGTGLIPGQENDPTSCVTWRKENGNLKLVFFIFDLSFA